MAGSEQAQAEQAQAEQAQAEQAQAGPPCAGCGAPLFAGESFCEACGRPRGAPVSVVACAGCGGDEFGLDGYCENCGLTRPDDRDHAEIETPLAGGVTDRGRRHSRNEDAMALSVLDGGGVAAVVCDGVSTSVRPQEAARTAADTGVAALAERLAAGDDPETATRTALLRAARTVAGLVHPGTDADSGTGDVTEPDPDAPACTYVSAVVLPPATTAPATTVTVGWVGDSRAYWLTGAGGGERLTTDDSWSEQMVASGQLTEAEARHHPNAHVLTGWLGADAGEPEPHVATFAPGGPGTVLICTAGRWNYRPEPADIAGAIPGADPLPAARALVRVALEAGGRDNITVVVIPAPLHGPENPT